MFVIFRSDLDEIWGFYQCWEVLTQILGSQIDSHNENGLVSHLVISNLRVELTVFTQEVRTKLLRIYYFV